MLSPKIAEYYKALRRVSAGNRFGLYSASVALGKARLLVEMNRKPETSRYSGRVVCYDTEQGAARAYVQDENPQGFRFVGVVSPSDSWNRSPWNNRGDTCGYYTEAFSDVFKDGSGLCWGEVWQLPGRRGVPRFVAGFRFGGQDCGLTLDLSRVFEGERNGSGYGTGQEDEAAREAARHADHLAERAADEERAYSAAWQAGTRFADLRDERASAKTELRELLKERRETKRESRNAPALCKAIADQARQLIETMTEAREAMRRLANGDGENERDCERAFWSGDERLQAAFCDGASLDVFPNL